MAESWTIIDDLASLLVRTREKPEEEREEFAYSVMMCLCDAYRPQRLRPGVNPVVDARIRELAAGRRGEAVRAARDALGVDLRTAQDYVDRLMAAK